MSADARGSQWHKWDLHVHTPASAVQWYGDPEDDGIWDRYLDELEELDPAITALGINDYNSVEGYRRVRAAKDAGRLQNIELILPVVELRLDSFAGHTDLQRINVHVLFSDELTADQIETLFLRSLPVELQLNGGQPWNGRVATRADMVELGRAMREATPVDRRGSESDLQWGFRSVAYPWEKVREILRQTVFAGKHLSAIGRNEWDQMRWDGTGGAQKKSLSHSADFVFTASPTVADYRRVLEQLKANEVNSKLIHASDAHCFTDSSQHNCLGATYAWIKADLTFEGLLRAVRQFDHRVHVGEEPLQRQFVRQHPHQFMDRLTIRKVDGSELAEKWFDDVDLPLNPGLVAIIGNQGSGKSALTDVLGLCGNSHSKDFGFLTDKKFCDATNRAKEFKATLRWASGEEGPSKILSESVDESAVERVRYVPQEFFASATNEKRIKREGTFYNEIKNVIFSHINEDDKLGRSNLDDLLKHKTREVENTVRQLRKELSRLNEAIIELEAEASPAQCTGLLRRLEDRRSELRAHIAAKPAPVDPPEETSAQDAEIERLREEKQRLDAIIEEAEGERALLKRKLDELDAAGTAVDTEARQIAEFLLTLQQRLDAVGLELTAADLLTYNVEKAPIERAREQVQSRIAELNGVLDEDEEQSTKSQRESLVSEIGALQEELQQANHSYQSYLTELSSWELERRTILGTRGAPESVRGLAAQLRRIKNDIPAKLAALYENRQHKTKEIHNKLAEIVAEFRTATDPIRQQIDETPLTREKYRLEIDIKLVEHALEELLFACVRQKGGTFGGVEEGRLKLREIVKSYDLDSPDGSVAMAEDILDKLKRDHSRTPPAPVELQSLMKKGSEVLRVYDLLFGLEYLAPEYGLTLNEKPLRQLSPGERGIVLLVFYLLVDKGQQPLIIDQPEGNLNNQSIFSNLVPVFTEAKKTRQIIIVTHNPNLAVVCDAEQIVHAEMNFTDGYRLTYLSGALENPDFNDLSLDVLEGTSPAFVARRDTYRRYG